MFNKKWFYGLIVLLSSILLLVSCSNDSETTDGDGESGEKVLTYWSMWNKGEPQQEVIQEIIDAYQEENPDVKIDVQWMGRQVMSDVRNAALNDEAPDLTEQSGAEVAGALLKNDLAEPLNDLLSMEIPNEGEVVADVFLDQILDFYTEDDNTYFIPYEVISSAFHYDKKLFEENNLEPPTTWDEFIALNDELVNKGIEPLAQDGNIDFYNAYYYYWAVERQLGPGKLNEAAGDKTGETWLEPGYLEAAKHVEELVEKGYFAEGYEGSQYPAAQTAWASGKQAMILNGSWLSSETQEYVSDDFEYGTFPFPEFSDGAGSYDQAELYLIGWVSPKGSQTDLVNDFLSFAMQKQYQEKIVTDTKNISTRKDLDAPADLEGIRNIVTDATSYHAEYDGLQADYPEWWKTVFLPLDDKLIFGEISAEEFVTELQKRSAEFWKN